MESISSFKFVLCFHELLLLLSALKLFLGLFILVYDYVCFAFVHVYAVHAYLVSMESERESDPLKRELDIVVSHVGAGNQKPKVLCKSNK